MKIVKSSYFIIAAFAASLLSAPFVGAEESVADKAAAKAESAAVKVEKDFDSAVKAAKSDGKKVMLEFSGIEWCPPCKMLHKFVLKTDEFAKYAKDKLHVVVADFDRFGAPKDKENADRINELVELYQVRGFPTVVILDSDGDVVDIMEGLQVRSASEMIDRIENAKEKKPAAQASAAACSAKKKCASKPYCGNKGCPPSTNCNKGKCSAGNSAMSK